VERIRFVRRLLLVALVLVAIVGVVFASWATRATPHVRDRIIAALNQRFESQVGLDSLQVAVFPRPALSGTGLTLRHEGRTDVPPLISIGSFEASAGVYGLIGKPLHLHSVALEGLRIQIPPGGLHGTHDSPTPDSAPGDRGDAPVPGAVKTSGDSISANVRSMLIDEIVSKAARLEIASSKPGKLPRIFDIDNLVMRDFGATAGSSFHAGLMNPVPRGRIETSGVIGPWNGHDPELTAVRGEYAFKNADLDVIKGIGGILSSVGTYHGVLQRVDVEGQTETPDFSIDIAGQPVPLSTRFKAVVDGTNGDTILDRVEARLGESTIIAIGSVVRTEDVKGRRVALDVKVDRARLEDLMRLAVKARQPPLTGRVDVQTKFLLPAGEADVVDRLQLNGRFSLAQARFTNFEIQKKINVLSRRGRGDAQSDGTDGNVVSNLSGRFLMRNARLDFSELTFAVPGAVVQLAGYYDLHAETIDFSGNLLADASLADMTTGFKSVLARLAQPLFRKSGGGSRIPIRITGLRSDPSFGLDVKRVFRRGDDKPKAAVK
jgi:hypothetical protein